MTSFKKILALAAAGLLASAMGANAAIVTNGSFEITNGTTSTSPVTGRTQADLISNPAGGTWAVFPSITGWTSVSGAGIEIQTAPTIPLNPQDGLYYVELDSDPSTNSNSRMRQNVNLLAGTTYQLRFAYSPREANSLTNVIEYGVVGSSVGLQSVTAPPNPSVGQWRFVTQNFTVQNDASYALEFAALGTQDKRGGFIDNVSINVIPLPAAVWLMLAGIGGLGLVSRRGVRAIA